MRYGIYLPNFGKETDARALAELAREAEAEGWDGFFLWDHILYSKTQRLPMVDPWVALTAVAMSTERIRFGTTVTPLARRRPWKLARETSTLDRLSGGRLTLSVGLGDPPDVEFDYFGEDDDNRARAAKLDEGLDILVGLWRGKPFQFQGEHYRVKKMVFRPKPMQSPRIPIWVGGFWPNRAPFRRAAKWDGVLPLKKGGRMEPQDVQDLLKFIHEHRESKDPFEVAIIGSRWTAGKGGLRGKEKVASFHDRGATWWLESLYLNRNSLEDMRSQIQLGPPRIE
jgi:alkanesulfonate monooxygenase SsuD/methylene tetrahydromethanopterin reductase-like flavin-dependent oxidoreductase (luciferase family)